MDKIRRYDRFISLGLNCETSFILYKKYGDMESSLFQWASVPAKNLIQTLNNPDCIYSGKIIEEPKVNMWKCAVTNIFFHGKHKTTELLDKNGNRDKEKIRAELKDTIGRIQYQREKFRIMAKSAETKLYVLGLYPPLAHRTNEERTAFLQELFTTLQNMAKNASLLVFVEKSMQTNEILTLDNDTNFFIRILDHFAPPDKAVSEQHVDLAGSSKILEEFALNRQSKTRKHYKFEDE